MTPTTCPSCGAPHETPCSYCGARRVQWRGLNRMAGFDAHRPEAFQLTFEALADTTQWPGWLCAAWDHGPGEGGFWLVDDAPVLGTLEGVYRVQCDDWIIRGIKGELYPCKPDIFAATYEAIA